jgi:hypothetical protein
MRGHMGHMEECHHDGGMSLQWKNLTYRVLDDCCDSVGDSAGDSFAMLSFVVVVLSRRAISS